MTQEKFIQEGYTILGTENNENKLLSFLKTHYPSVIKDNEINLNELKAVAGLPIDEKVNGYGLNFVGRNFARAKYAQKTTQELHLNNTMSKDLDTTQNLVLKGDNLDSLKILKNHYTGKIKCIYIDPPYNTTSDEFVYPDKFDKEEAEVLGLQNLSEYDFDRMDFSFKSKKSHNGWLAFIYPRLLLARDLLSQDGVIFISIDDNEQANLKLLCDDVFGEENFVANVIWNSRKSVSNDTIISLNHNSTLFYAKNISELQENKLEYRLTAEEDKFSNPDNDPRGNWVADPFDAPNVRPNLSYPIENPKNGKIYMPPKGRCWRTTYEEYIRFLNEGRIIFGKTGKSKPQLKRYFSDAEVKGVVAKSIWDDVGTTTNGTQELESILGEKVFDNPKPISLILRVLEIATNKNSIILDFFAGSGTTGHAVMQLNAEDGGNRKFILCQIDEPIKKDKPAYQFCIENNLPPVISSITIERLKRAGAKITDEIATANSKSGMFEEHKTAMPDVGFKVFDSVTAPKLVLNGEQIEIKFENKDTLSRIYNMIFTIGLDEPTQVPETVIADCIYKIGTHYYITNSEKVSKEALSEVIKKGKVFIDGWTASINGTLQHYKEDVKIVF